MSGDQIPSVPGRKRRQMPGVCQGGCLSFDVTGTLSFFCQYSNHDIKQIPNYSSCSFPEYPLFYSPKRSYLAVVAIDFGTTYSGFAFSFNKDRGKDSIFMNMDWVNEHGSQTSKTPTCLLLKPDLSFDSFGYDAIEKYAGLEGDDGEKEHFFFKHFKMTLHNDKVWSVSLPHWIKDRMYERRIV